MIGLDYWSHRVEEWSGLPGRAMIIHNQFYGECTVVVRAEEESLVGERSFEVRARTIT